MLFIRNRKIKALCIIAILLLQLMLPIIIESGVTSISQAQDSEVINNSEYSKAYQKYLALSDEEKAKVTIIPRMYDIPLDMLYKKEPLKALATYSQELPEYFNLRSIIDIPVRDQGGYGLCSFFGVMKSLETNVALLTRRVL